MNRTMFFTTIAVFATASLLAVIIIWLVKPKQDEEVAIAPGKSAESWSATESHGDRVSLWLPPSDTCYAVSAGSLDGVITIIAFKKPCPKDGTSAPAEKETK